MRLKVNIRFINFLFILIGLITFMASNKSYAAACCGGSSQVPTLITTDDRSQIISTFSQAEIVVDNVDGDGFWYKSKNNQKINTFKIDYTYVWDNDLQAGLSIPVVNRSYMGETSSGLADMQTTVGYEFLPEREYNIWKPKGFVYSALILPTGKSKYESEIGGLDSRGRGLWGVSVGLVFVKVFKNFDFVQSSEVHHYLNSTKSKNNGATVDISHSLGAVLQAGMGYNWDKSRIGFGLTHSYEGPFKTHYKTIQTESYHDGAIENVTSLNLGYSYMMTDLSGVTVSYSNQTWLGTPRNTSLSSTVSVQLNKRWLR